MTAEDVSPLAQIYFEIFSGDWWAYDWLKAENALDYFRAMRASPMFKGFVFMEGGVLIGACFGELNSFFITPQYHIKEIFIAQALQRTGLGSFYLRETENALKSMGVRYITLYTLKTIPAYGFYIKNNYKNLPDSVHMGKAVI